MRIAVVNPATTDLFTRALEEQARRYARPDTEVEVLRVAWGPASIEGHFDEELAAVAMLDLLARRRGDFDGFAIACYGDPGLYAARELSPVPVVGIGEASLLLACLVAHRFSVVTILPRFRPAILDMVRRYGLELRCASVRSTPIAVLAADDDPAATERRIVEESRRAVDEDGAEAICLGCGGFSLLDKRVEAAVGVPVIDGVSAAVQLLEALGAYGLRTSRAAAFKAPEPKEITITADILGVFRRDAP